jgi:hypothetical protein
MKLLERMRLASMSLIRGPRLLWNSSSIGEHVRTFFGRSTTNDRIRELKQELERLRDSVFKQTSSTSEILLTLHYINLTISNHNERIRDLHETLLNLNKSAATRNGIRSPETGTDVSDSRREQFRILPDASTGVSSDGIGITESVSVEVVRGKSKTSGPIDRNVPLDGE